MLKGITDRGTSWVKPVGAANNGQTNDSGSPFFVGRGSCVMFKLPGYTSYRRIYRN